MSIGRGVIKENGHGRKDVWVAREGDGCWNEYPTSDVNETRPLPLPVWKGKRGKRRLMLMEMEGTRR